MPPPRPPGPAPPPAPPPPAPAAAPAATGVSPADPSAAAPSASAALAASPTMVVRAYFVLEDPTGVSPGLVPVLRVVPRTVAVATAAVRQLLAGPSRAERIANPRVITAVPTGTRLLGIRIASGTATVNVSHEFASGGGSLSMFMRLGQLTWTVTQFPTVTRVRLQLNGVPVTTFSGEGIVLSAPLTRASFRDDILAPISVDRPAYRAALGCGPPRAGVAHGVGAALRVAGQGAPPHVLVNRQVLATCGTGCWGRFDVTVPYTISHAQWGWLRVWSASAKDGSAVNVREEPVWLTP